MLCQVKLTTLGSSESDSNHTVDAAHDAELPNERQIEIAEIPASVSTFDELA